MSVWIEIISSLFIFAGVVFMISSTIGIIRLPDFYIRISAVAKAITLAVTLILIGIGIYFNTLEVGSKIVMIFVFMVITTPVAAHIVGRAATKNKVPFWYKTVLDECKIYLKAREEEK